MGLAVFVLEASAVAAYLMGDWDGVEHLFGAPVLCPTLSSVMMFSIIRMSGLATG